MNVCFRRYLMWTLIVKVALLHASAQESPQPSVQDVMAKVYENYTAYLHTVPNLYANENMLAKVTYITSTSLGALAHADDQHVTYDSHYRLERGGDSKGQSKLEETRQLVAIDHKPASANQKLIAPNLVIDSVNAPNVFWPGWGTCFDYKLAASRRWRGKKVLVLEYATESKVRLQNKCPLREPVSGRALIDAETMTIVRFEQRRPRHPPEMSTIQKMGLSSEAFGDWQWSIDYAPVTLHGKSYWLPKTITSTYELFERAHVLWSFVSNYNHYQLATVRSRVLLPDGTELKKQ